jgi:DMSO/TMAO reductase YedYZ molybdopterin-dependent catalytic subunit
MKVSTFRGVASALLIAAMLTAALLAILFLGWKVFGLPFVPFNVFDWLTRHLPGSVISFGISSMVSIIRGLDLGSTSETAKLGEQALGVVGCFLVLIVGAAIGFALLRVLHGRHALLVGFGLGMCAGVPAMLVSLDQTLPRTANPTMIGLWVLGCFLVWGALVGWSESRLIALLEFDRPDQPQARPVAEALAQRIDRRRFLIRLGGATATITVVGAVVGESIGRRRNQTRSTGERWSANHPLPNADATVTPAQGTRPELTPLEQHYRIDINTTPPVIDGDKWRLKVHGLVDSPQTLTLDHLRSHQPLHQFVTLSCISNPIGGDLTGTTRWTGVSLQRLLPDWKIKPGATCLKLTAADGFFEVVSLDAIRKDARIMLTYEWDGLPLESKHGFPLRIYIPDLYGMKQPKWIESIEAIAKWEPGYWVKRGWDKVAQMKATSVIDTIAMGMEMVGANERTLVPIGGIAHAGARGISRVEVQVDKGPWREAKLRSPLSALTWVIWRYDWPFVKGNHTFAVRCFDGKGMQQIEQPSSPEPAGATGIHTKTSMF